MFVVATQIRASLWDRNSFRYFTLICICFLERERKNKERRKRRRREREEGREKKKEKERKREVRLCLPLYTQTFQKRLLSLPPFLSSLEAITTLCLPPSLQENYSCDSLQRSCSGKIWWALHYYWNEFLMELKIFTEFCLKCSSFLLDVAIHLHLHLLFPFFFPTLVLLHSGFPSRCCPCTCLFSFYLVF